MTDDLGVEVVSYREDPDASVLYGLNHCWRPCSRGGPALTSGLCRCGRWRDAPCVRRARAVGSLSSAAARGCGGQPAQPLTTKRRDPNVGSDRRQQAVFRDATGGMRKQ
jgi:hypothetical protein